MSQSRKVAVTGGAGFIGSHVVDLLLSRGHEVVVIDSLVTGRPKNIERHKDHPKFKFIHADVNDLEKVNEALKGVYGICHLAALADIVPSIQRPLDYHRANVDGTVSIMECARLAGVKRVVYAASSSCYGLPDKIPTPETSAIDTRYPYSLTKFLGEQIALHWGQVYGLGVVSLRFFNVYGPRSRTSGTYGAVFGVFLAQKIKGAPFTIVGDGNQTRDFTFVTDVARAVCDSLESDLGNEILNVGSGKPTSVNRIADLLGGVKSYIPKRPGEPDATEADNTKMKAKLGWEAKVSIEDGVKQMLACIDDWKDAPVWTPEKIAEATKEWFQFLK